MGYRPNGGLFDRDVGLLALTMQRMGFDSKLVLLNGPGPSDDALPLLLTDEASLADPNWWQRQHPDVVFFNSWGEPRMIPVAKAIRESGATLVLKLDSDGIVSSRVSLYHATWFTHTAGVVINGTWVWPPTSLPANGASANPLARILSISPPAALTPSTVTRAPLRATSTGDYK